MAIDVIKLAMSLLGSRKKTMSKAAIEQRQAAGKASGKARRNKRKETPIPRLAEHIAQFTRK